jgi:hypothetical protein
MKAGNIGECFLYIRLNGADFTLFTCTFVCRSVFMGCTFWITSLLTFVNHTKFYFVKNSLFLMSFKSCLFPGWSIP